MNIEPGTLGQPTERDIKAAWDAAEKPSLRTVCARMRAEGWETSVATIQRVVSSGFKPRGIRGAPKKPMPPPEAQAVAVGDALLEAIHNLPPGAKDRVKELIGMDEQELENQTNRLVKVARYLLAEDLAQHTKMMMLAPDKAAKLYQALGTGLVPVIAPPMPGAGDNAKVVEHNPNEPRQLSPSAQAIADFRARRGSVAA